LESCTGCGKSIHLDEPVTAIFTSEGKRSYYHRECDEKTEHFAKWREEAAWVYKPTRLTVADWKNCSPRKHLGVWQSIFIARRDEDVWCPDCGLKISRNERIRCAVCGAPAIVLGIESTRMVFTHREPLYKLLLHCTEKGDESSTYAIISGFTPVAVTSKRGGQEAASSTDAIMLKYEPKGDPKRGFAVG
jgi:hypothetical protein